MKTLFKLILQTVSFFNYIPQFRLTSLGDGLLRYKQAVVQGVIQGKVQVDFEDMEIYDDQALYDDALMNIIYQCQSTGKMKGAISTKQNPVKGWDRQTPKGMHAVTTQFTSQSSAGTVMDLTLASKKKYELQVNMKITFSFTSTGSGWTNEARIMSLTQISGVADDYTIQVRAEDATEKIGIDTGVVVPADTTYFITTGATYADDSTSDDGPTYFEYPIENFYSFIKHPYAVADNAKNLKLFGEENLLRTLDRNARAFFLRMRMRELLHGGKMKFTTVSSESTASTSQYSKMLGLLRNIRLGGSPAVTTYDGTSTTFESAHERVMYEMADADESTFLAICTDTYQKYWTDKMASSNAYRIEDDTTWGIPGIKNIHTGYGDMKLQLIVNKDLSRWHKLKTGGDWTKPMVIFLVPYKVRLYEFGPKKFSLHTNIQAPDRTVQKNEYRCAFSYLAHNIETPNYGLIEYSA